MVQKITKFLAIALLLGATSAVHARIPSWTRAERGEDFIPKASAVKAIALGFDAVLADFYWLWAVQIVGRDGARPVDRATDLGRLIDVVTTLDPWVGHPYRFAAVWLTDREESVRTANRLLERGIEHHPLDWRNHYHLGFNHFFYLGEYEEAAQALERAVSLPGSPAYLPRLVARLRSQEADLEAASIFLNELIQRTPDAANRAQLQSALDEIEIEYQARALDEAREVYRKKHGRDIERVEDLVSGPGAVLTVLPSAEPGSLPAALRRDLGWQLDPETKRIVSEFYGRRYEVHVPKAEKERNRRWEQAREREARHG